MEIVCEHVSSNSECMLEIDYDETVQTLKNKVREALFTPFQTVETILLQVHATGEAMDEDEAPISDYHLEHGSTVLVVTEVPKQSKEQSSDMKFAALNILTRDKKAAQAMLLDAIMLDPRNYAAYEILVNSLPDTPSGNDLTSFEVYASLLSADPCHTDTYLNLCSMMGPSDYIVIHGKRIGYPQVLARTLSLYPRAKYVWALIADTFPADGTVRLDDGTEYTKEACYKKGAVVSCPLSCYHLALTLDRATSEVVLSNGKSMTKRKLLLIAQKEMEGHDGLERALGSL